MTTAKWSWADVEAFAVGLGPGGFTSLRIGLATAKTLAYSLKKPLFGISTLDILRHGFDEPNCIALIDAKRNEVYIDLPDAGLHCLAPSALCDHLHSDVPYFFCGDGACRYETQLRESFPLARFNLSATDNVPNAAHLSALISVAQPDQIATLQPLYVRPSDAEITYPDGFPDAVTQFKL
jgi:tRNA threonylcarbamoyl adenosine modification protein YeaZ